MTRLRSSRIALLVIAPALVLATAAGGCGRNGTDGREQNVETQPAATPTSEQPLSPYATLTRTEARALAVKACTTGQFAATVAPHNPVDACVDRIYHQATDKCFHEADSLPGVPDEIVRQRCSAMEGALESWAGEGEQPEQYPGGDATDSMGAEPTSTPDRDELPPELRNLDPNDPDDCPPTGPMPVERRIACGLE
jgi:hypothetical protein